LIKRGRPVEPVPAQHKQAILEWIQEGRPLRAYCRLTGSPNWRTVYDWLEKDAEFAALFARARDAGADAIAEEALEILDQVPERVDGEGGGRYDAAFVTWQRNRAEYRLKLLSKWNPKKYGEKLDLGVSGNAGLSIRVDLGDKDGES